VVQGETSEGDDMGWTEEQVAAMVATARQGDIQTQAVMALLTVYAPRISEVVKITKKDIDFKKMVITIHTVKHNLIRRHLIPEPVQFVICKYDWLPVTEQKLRDVFETVAANAKVERRPRQSVHAFRHSLWTELSFLGFSPQEIYEFTGWSRGGTLGVYLPPLKYNPNNDKKIFEKHPFLKLWV
jgi:integrase